MDINLTNPVTTAKIGEVVNGASAATPNDTDLLPVIESSVTKKLTLTNLKAFLKTYFDTLYSGGSVTVNSIGSAINGATSATPNDTDLVMSVESSVAKKNTWTQVKAFLKTYFDTLYGLKSYYYTGQFLSVNPADSTSYHFNGNSSTPSTTDTQRSFLFGKAGIIDRVFLGYQQNVNGSGESNTLYLRNITTATDYEVGTFASNFGTATGSGFNFESLSISVNSTDSYTWKILTPAYSTNPTLWIGNLMARLLY